MAFVSVSPWWTVSGLGGQWLQTQMGWVSSLMMYARLMHWVSGHVSQAVFRVSGCLWTRTLTFRGVQVVSPEWRAGRLNHCDQGQVQTPDTGSGGSWGKLCQCLDSDNVVSDDPGMCHGPWSVILFEQIFDLGNDTRRLWFYQQFIATLKYFRLLEIFKLSSSTCALSKEACFIHLTRLHFRRTGVIREFYTQLHKINMAR